MSNLLVFGAGELQIPIIKNAKEKGCKVIAIDPDKNAPGKYCTDLFFKVKGNDYKKTIYLCKKYKINGIVTAATDKPLLMMARIAEKMNYKYSSLKSIETSTHKHLFKECMQENNIHVAKGVLIENSLIDFQKIKHLKYPLIIKPVDSSGSRGVIYIRNFRELKKNLHKSFEYSKEKKVLIEEFIQGKEFSIESITYNNKTKVLAFTDKITTPFPFNVELGHIQPANLDKTTKLKIIYIVKKMVKSLCLDNCACHTEIKLTSNGIVLIENGARLGGDFITSHLVPLSTGINMESLVIDISLGKKIKIPGNKNYCSLVKYLVLPIGKVMKVKNLEFLNNCKELIEFKINVKEGDRIKRIENSLDRYGQFIFRGKSRDELEKISNKLIEKTQKNIIIK